MEVETTLMEIETTLSVNKFARRARHEKNFSRASRFKNMASAWRKTAMKPMKALLAVSAVAGVISGVNQFKSNLVGLAPMAPQKRLLFQAGMVATTALLVTSFTGTATFSPVSMDYSNDYIAAYSLPGDILVSDESGYLVKINPQTSDSNRVGLTDYAVHTVESGESLSVIGEKYGIKVNTIMWENNIGNANSLRIGQTLLIPPVNGIGYKVKSGDTLTKVAGKYDISTEAIIAQNGLESETLYKGQSVFLPGAKPLYKAPTVASRAGVNRSGNARPISGSASSSTPVGGKSFIFPTRGGITQGFHGGHYALDIADRSRPPVWSTASGTVVKASSGTWGGGYGNHVIIDHGGGLQTLYAHLGTLNVYQGQYLNQGDIVGMMGNTGRVYGATGIHLHWEVRLNGVKQNPYYYY